jgi:hypothetical protein
MKKNLELSKVSVDNIKQLQGFIASAKSDADKLTIFILISIFNFKKIYN